MGISEFVGLFVRDLIVVAFKKEALVVMSKNFAQRGNLHAAFKNMNRTAASGEVKPTIRRVASPPKQRCNRGSRCQRVLQSGMGVLKREMNGASLRVTTTSVKGLNAG